MSPCLITAVIAHPGRIEGSIAQGVEDEDSDKDRMIGLDMRTLRNRIRCKGHGRLCLAGYGNFCVLSSEL
jgi:hypothetical protein